MEAYAAVTSLLKLLGDLQLYHARQPIFLAEQQRLLEYLAEKVSSLQTYLETYHCAGVQDAESLESRIAYKSYEAEDTIETHIVDDFRVESSKKREAPGSSNNFSQQLEKIIAEIDCIENEVTGIKEKSTLKDQQNQSSSPISSSRAPPSRNDFMVGLCDETNRIIDKLTLGTERTIIPITGMGGIGKTTLAKNVLDSHMIVQHFDVLRWVTVSQEYDVRGVLLCLLRDIGAKDDEDNQGGLECHEVGLKVHKYLYGRRYLIVLDDMWSIKAWDAIQSYLPCNNNGSKILVTSRLETVAYNFDTANHFKMNLLDEGESWILLCKKAYNQESCPPEFEETGKAIARGCKGLPLTIVVIGGLLAKCKMVLQHWKDILEDISHVALSGEDDHCLRILSLSYNQLPIYLKPCFIYMGIFPEDHRIRVSVIIKLWVSEGFLKPVPSKSLEEVAEDCLKDLIDRNLISVDEFGLTQQIKSCKIHDLLRGFCIGEARKGRFFYLVEENTVCISQERLSHMRRIAYNGRTIKKNIFHQLQHVLQSASFLRTFVGHYGEYGGHVNGPLLTLDNFELLRVLEDGYTKYSMQDILQLINARYVSIWNVLDTESPRATDTMLFWNIQTIVQNGYYSNKKWDERVPIIWKLPQLRHIMVCEIFVPDPPNRVDDKDIVVLENLQTLGTMQNFRCTPTIFRRLTNIKKLKIFIRDTLQSNDINLSLDSLKDLCQLQKLQSLRFYFSTSSRFEHSESFLENVKFPHSLKKLHLGGCRLEWDEMGTLIGRIPQLVHLILDECCIGSWQWNTAEGQFSSLKVLKLNRRSPVEWNIEFVHFPCLEHLVLENLKSTELSEIPPGFGEIDTLRSICLVAGYPFLVDSAKKILEEQRELGNEDFSIKLIDCYD